MQRMLERITTWIDSLPDTLRPAAYGALFIVLFMLMRGAWLVAPLAIIYVFVTSATPLLDIARGASVVGLAMVGGALSGLAYGLVGRHLRTAMPGGRYLTGIITIAPYMFLLTVIIRLADGKPLWQPLAASDIWVSVGMSLLFGTVMGHTWFAREPAGQADTRGSS
jgi:hypothetical protein